MDDVPTSVRVEVWDRCHGVRQILDAVLIGDAGISADLLTHLAGVLSTRAGMSSVRRGRPTRVTQ
jgi:hypothetical protein